MIELKDWIDSVNLPDKPWLVLGKGPSFSARSQFDLSQFNTFGLNHVAREQAVTCAHIIDIDVVEACQEKLLTNCEWLIIPRVPHVRCFASEYVNLKDWLECMPVLKEADERGKLVVYSLAHFSDERDPWTIEARYFSSEVAFGILGRMKAKHLKLLGIDGGKDYSPSFQDLNQNTLLINQQPSFDLQFQQLRKLSSRFGIDYAHLVEDLDRKMKEHENAVGADLASEELAADQDLEIVLPKVSEVKIGSPQKQSEPEEEFESLPRAMEYAATYMYRRKVFPKATISKNEELTASEKIQLLENDLRLYRERLEDTLEELAKVSKDMVVCHQRLGWCRNELDEYRARALDLERSLHRLVSSRSWKVGRALTKPAEIFGKKMNPEAPG
jgi:hypothetical protein